MKRLFLAGLFFNLALLIIGVTWIAPIEAHQDRAEFASVAPGLVAPAPIVAGGPMTVALNQWSITPQALQAPAGPVTFTVSNDGTMTP